MNLVGTHKTSSQQQKAPASAHGNSAKAPDPYNARHSGNDDRNMQKAASGARPPIKQSDLNDGNATVNEIVENTNRTDKNSMPLHAVYAAVAEKQESAFFAKLSDTFARKP
jgi:hypothetical protein